MICFFIFLFYFGIIKSLKFIKVYYEYGNVCFFVFLCYFKSVRKMIWWCDLYCDLYVFNDFFMFLGF